MYAIVHHSKGIVQDRTKPVMSNGWRTVTAEATQMAVAGTHAEGRNFPSEEQISDLTAMLVEGGQLSLPLVRPVHAQLCGLGVIVRVRRSCPYVISEVAQS